MPGDLQMLLLNVTFLTLLMQRLLGQQTTKMRIATRDVEAEAESGSGPFSVEAEVRKSYRFRFHIGYWQKSFVHFPMWIKR